MWEALRGAGPVSEATFSFLRNAAKAAGVAAGQSAYDRCGAAEAPWRPLGHGAVCGSVAVSLGQGAGRAGYHNNRAAGQDVGQQVSHSSIWCRRAGRCILRRRDSRCVVSERHRAGVLGLGCPMHGELARPASPHEVGEGALTAVCPPAGPNLPAAQ